MLRSVLIVVLLLLNTGAKMSDGFTGEIGVPGLGKIGFSHDDGEDRAYANFLRDIEYGRQKEFAQSGISWRVADAKAAGVHPVWALGGGGAAYSPQPIQVGADRGGSWSIKGQDVSRAAQSTMSPEEKILFELDLDMKKIQRESMQIDLDAKRRNRDQIGPGMPSTSIPGDMFAGDFATTKPAERISHDSEDWSTTASAASPGYEKFHISDADGRPVEIVLPSGGKGTMTEALESMSESWPLLYAGVSENLRRDPELIYKMRHLWPGGEMATYIARMLEQGMQAVLNAKKRTQASKEIARQWWERFRSDEAKKRGLK